MATVIEKKICSVQFPKSELINSLLSAVNPSVTANDIVSLGQAGEPGFFRVLLQATTSGGVTTKRVFDITEKDLVSTILVNYDPAIVASDVLSVSINGSDPTKIDVQLIEKQVALYG